MAFKSVATLILVLCSGLSEMAQAAALPRGFVYLKEIDPTIVQELRYAGDHNFIGSPVAGYESHECILTRQAAEALKAVQAELRQQKLSLKVYDCYRPQRAVNAFIHWSKQINQQQMKTEFYPRVNKADVFKLGYVAEKSGHTRGSTVDLTIVPLPAPLQASYHRGQTLSFCYAPRAARFQDNSIDMGTGYDCLDESAHINYQFLTSLQRYNRALLNQLMFKHGFKPYTQEWWHFSLAREPYPRRYFDFPVR